MRKKDSSFGVVAVYRTPEKQFEVFLIRHRAGGHWGFPKGHANEGEEPFEAAIRELKEETSLQIKSELLSQQVLVEQYVFHLDQECIQKTVQYFIGEVTCRDVAKIDPSEVMEGKWVEINQAPMHLTFEESKRICREAAQLLQVNHEYN